MLIALVPALKDIAFAKIKTSVELAKFRRQTMTAGLKFLPDSLPVQCVVFDCTVASFTGYLRCCLVY